MRTIRAPVYWCAAAVAAALWLAMLYAGNWAGAPNQGLLRSLYMGPRSPMLGSTIGLTKLGGWVSLTVLTIGAAGFLIYRRRPTRAALLLLTVFGGRMVVELQKLVFAHPRPDATEHLVRVSSMSFPSAHAANSMITFIAIASLIPMAPRWRVPAIATGILLSMAIGLSRIALGVHWPADVIGGWAFGVAWVLLWFGLARARPEAEAELANPATRNRVGRSFILRVKERKHGKSEDRQRPRP